MKRWSKNPESDHEQNQQADVSEDEPSYGLKVGSDLPVMVDGVGMCFARGRIRPPFTWIPS